MESDQVQLASYLSFSLAGELFAIHVDFVIKILEMTSFTKIPQGPPYLLGVINLTGSVLPVVDSRLKFGFKTDDEENKGVIIVLQVNFNGKLTSLGITADAVNEVFETEQTALKEYPSVGGKYNADYIQGVFQRNNRFILLLDVNKLFGEDEINDFVEPSI